MQRLTYVLFASVLALPLSSCGIGSGSERSVDRSSENGDEGEECAFTQGYWKNHSEAWPVETLTLGTVSYSKEELLSIFHTPVAGNGLIQLAHQLIAAKLNVANGSSASIADAIADADALIGDLVVPPVGEGHLATRDTSPLAGALDSFNNEGECAGEELCGDGHMAGDEKCDDGNTVDGDGCSSSCALEIVCGDGHMVGDEKCDDGNTVDGDGCSSSCALETVCGNGRMEGDEKCDDGNTVNGDGCSSSCALETACGNGHMEGDEKCDDGNTADGDGCSSKCTLETACGDGHMDAGEECDDGNTADGDGCSSKCVCE